MYWNQNLFCEVSWKRLLCLQLISTSYIPTMSHRFSCSWWKQASIIKCQCIPEQRGFRSWKKAEGSSSSGVEITTRFRATVASLILGLVQNSPRRSSRRWIRCTWWFGTLSCPLRSAGLFCQAAANVCWSFVICRHVLACRTHSCRYHRREVSACQTWSHPPLQRDLYRIHTSPAPLQGAPLITTNSIYNYSKTLITQPTPLSQLTFNTWINVQIRIRSRHQRDQMSWAIGQNKDGCHIFSFCLWTKWNQNFPDVELRS